MTLRVIRNNFATVEATFPALVSSDFLESDDGANWNSATAYTVGQRVVDPALHKRYECLVANTNAPPSSNTSGATPKWAEVSYTNPYRMFDAKNSSQSSKTAATAVMKINPGRINALYLGNLACNSVDVLLKDGATTVYSKSINLQASSVFDWYDYFMEPIVLNTDAALFDLPAIGTAQLTLTFNGGSLVAVGTVLMGLFRTMGTVQWEPTVRLLDYSTYKTNAYGDVDIVKRLPARIIDAKMFVPLQAFNEVNRLAADFVGDVLLWSFQGDQYPSLNVLGFPKDFSHVLSSPAGSFFNVQVQGLT